MFYSFSIDPLYLIGDQQQKASWSVENGYEIYGSSFPRRLTSTANKYGLSVSLATLDFDQDYLCQGPIEGFNVRKLF